MSKAGCLIFSQTSACECERRGGGHVPVATGPGTGGGGQEHCMIVHTHTHTYRYTHCTLVDSNGTIGSIIYNTKGLFCSITHGPTGIMIYSATCGPE